MFNPADDRKPSQRQFLTAAAATSAAVATAEGDTALAAQSPATAPAATRGAPPPDPGKLADLAVLDRDYFTVPDADIRRVSSVLTVVGGRIVHDNGVV